MTAILGFVCTDGILLLADTEEIIGDSKSECEKLDRFILPHGTAIFAGAGDTHQIEFAAFKARQRLLQKPFTNWAAVYDDLSKFAKDIVQETVGAYKGFALSDVPGSANQTLIGLYSPNQGAKLFRWSQNAVVPILSASASIGAGSTRTEHMLSELQDAQYNPYRATGSCDSTLFHGVRIMRQTKLTVNGCGKKTEAMAMMNTGDIRIYGTGKTEQIEAIVHAFEQYCHRSLSPLISFSMTDEQFTTYSSNVINTIRSMREQYMSLIAPQSNVP